jgi:LacI family transcriptional regulator
MSRVTTYDVAKEAGVSLATVDRVLNKRKGVRSETIKRVVAAMERLNFVLDQTAANLARSRSYRFTFIVSAGETSFFSDIQSEVEAAKFEAAKERIDIQMLTVPPLDPQAIVEVIEGVKTAKLKRSKPLPTLPIPKSANAPKPTQAAPTQQVSQQDLQPTQPQAPIAPK